MWKAKLQSNYRSESEFRQYSQTYGLAEKLGFRSARAAWNANPLIQGSTNPADFKVVAPKPVRPV